MIRPGVCSALGRAVVLGLTLLALGGLAERSWGQGKGKKAEGKGFDRSAPPFMKDIGLDGVMKARRGVAGPEISVKATLPKSFAVALDDGTPVAVNNAAVPVTLTRQAGWQLLNLPTYFKEEGTLSVKETATSSWTHLARLKRLLGDANLMKAKGGAFSDALIQDLNRAILEEKMEAAKGRQPVEVKVPRGHLAASWQLIEVVKVRYDWDGRNAYEVLSAMKKGPLSKEQLDAARSDLESVKLSWPTEEFRIELRTQADLFAPKLKSKKK